MQESNYNRKCQQNNHTVEKLIRLSMRDTNFQFRDDQQKVHFKVHYPHTSFAEAPNQNIYKYFWQHVQSHYFKKIDVQEIKRLNYAYQLFQNSNPTQLLSLNFPFIKQKQFWRDILDVVEENYLLKLVNVSSIQQEDQNWVKSTYIQWKNYIILNQNQQKIQKRKLIHSKIKQNRKIRSKLSKKSLIKSNKEESILLSSLIEELDQQQCVQLSQIDKQINRLERQSLKVKHQTLKLVVQLNQQIQGTQGSQQNSLLLNDHSGFRMEMEESQMSDTNENLDSIELAIKELEEKQLAESIATIISHERSNGEIKFLLTFQKAINIQPKLMNQKELLKMNRLREISLLKFYKTGIKSLYSYICHNYAGFHELIHSRSNLVKVKDKDFLLSMKKGQYMSNIYEIQSELNNFNICHHCKYLFPQNLLVTCKFSSQKQSMPKNLLEISIDTDIMSLTQDANVQRNRISHRFLSKNKNCITSYAKINDEYVCGRKYCKPCIKDYYSEDSIADDGVCPFCEGCCTCTRCLRNQKIIKFKNMYANEGGDINKIQTSILDCLESKENQIMLRGRGRPKIKLIQKQINFSSISRRIQANYNAQNQENQKNLINQAQTNREIRFLKKKKRNLNKLQENKHRNRSERFNQCSQTQKGSQTSQKQNHYSHRVKKSRAAHH